VYVEFFQRFDHCSRSAPTSARSASPILPPPSRAQNLAAGHARRLGHASHAADRFTVVMTWQSKARGRRRQQGSGVSQVSRPAVADITGLSWPSTDRSVCCGEHGWQQSTRWASPARFWTIDPSSRHPGANSASPSTPPSRTRFGGSAIRTECYLASGRARPRPGHGWTPICPHDEGLLAFWTRSGAGRHRRINSGLRAHARRAVEIAHEHFGCAPSAATAARRGER